MLKKKMALFAALAGVAGLLSIPALTTAAKAKPAAKSAAKKVNDGREQCYSCHDEVKALKEGSKHASISCKVCHDKTAGHMNDPEKNKPVTIIDQALCGKCHKDQYDSFFKIHYDATPRKDKGMPTGRSPMQDKLLDGHGFTFEHAEPRGHAYMVIDQFVADRFQGGRFQYKKGWDGVDQNGRAWDVLVDTGKKLPQTAMAGNATCIQCKTSDHILNIKYMGDKDPKAKFDRASNPVEVAKATNNAVGCIHCHDPHGAQPRVVRDALIDAIDKDPKGNIFAKNGKTDLKIVSFRDGFRKIGVMQKSDSRMMCAQCHVEYNCNPGTQPSDGKPVKFDDRRTNLFPLKNSLQLFKYYQSIDFYDFKHAVTGARLIKFQHPEAETYAGSVHDKAGVQCHQCHMPQQKGKNGKMFSNHGVTRPKLTVKESCISCHPNSTVQRKAFQIETVQGYIKGKMRKAEYWLGQLIDTYAAAQRLGVTESVLAQARLKHEEAHALWEYWTAENSDGFHNPEQARESLTGSITASKEGVKILNDAMKVAREGAAKK